MRVLGLISLAVALCLVALLMRKPLSVLSTPPPTGALNAASKSPKSSSDQILRQTRDALDAAMQPRPMPDD